ncbi:MAG: TIGR01777 family oxidoreductase [Candidatus Yanofskybacteria bacterium]|nr:TIGR01777 family oxidoreductase [Candidatus Yanofskybacteria bacterium]
MRVLITGGSGFIGTHLTKELLRRGYTVRILDMRPSSLADAEFFQGNLADREPSAEVFAGVDAVVHLAGKNIFGRWNPELKKQIKESRSKGTSNLVAALRKLPRKPEVLVSASAVGFYGDRGEEELLEESSPGSDFLSGVCVEWEREAEGAQGAGIRVVRVRTASVLASAGLLAQLLSLYRFGLGGSWGNGKQWFPWIHLQDIIGIYVFALENRSLKGAYNAAAPRQVRQKEFSSALARAIWRPHFLRIPAWVMRFALGEFADVSLASQKVSSQKIQAAGYSFVFPELKEALSDLLRESR